MPVLKPPSGANDQPKQYKQPSRKGKGAWRKNIDLTQVTEGLEELNKQIIAGGVTAEKASDELFTLDTSRDKTIAKKFPQHARKGLRADEIIAQRSAVPAVSMRKRPGDKTGNGILPAKRQRATYVTQKELAKLRKVADGQHETPIDIPEATFDMWAEPAAPKPVDEDEFSFLTPAAKVKPPKTYAQEPISLAANGKAIPAVLKPKAGSSYNPVFDEYRDMLVEEGEKAVVAERKRLAELEAERLKLEAAARSAAEAEAAEARAELSEWDEESAWEGIESGGEELTTKAKRPERKTPAQRNRIKRRKEEERRVKHEARSKAKNEQAQRIKAIAKEVAEREQKLALAKAAAGADIDGASDGESEASNDEQLRRRQLGKYKLPERDLELVLPDELQDSLRLLKPEGNLLSDRYRSLLVRGKVEARRRIPYHKQKKVKYTEKWSFKDFSLD